MAGGVRTSFCTLRKQDTVLTSYCLFYIDVSFVTLSRSLYIAFLSFEAMKGRSGRKRRVSKPDSPEQDGGTEEQDGGTEADLEAVCFHGHCS